MVSPTIEAGERLEVGVEWGAYALLHNRFLYWLRWCSQAVNSSRRSRVYRDELPADDLMGPAFEKTGDVSPED
jgi:hypothetical protein